MRRLAVPFLHTLIDDNRGLLEQARSLTGSLSREVYAGPLPDLGLSSFGSHLRHILDFYGQLLAGIEANGVVNYDQRERLIEIEVNPAAGLERLAEVHAQLAGLRECSHENLRVRSDAMPANATQDPYTTSSLERELQSTLSHTTHHFALMRVGLRSRGITPIEGFGVAPSTLRYWAEVSACAP